MKFVRVDIPIRSPQGTLDLAKQVSDRHTALGAGSQLTGFVDMAVFETNRASAALLQQEGDTADADAQTKYNETRSLCGIAVGQTKETEDKVYFFVLQIRDVLLLKHKGIEETLEQYGFNVVISQTGARKNVRVTIPNDNPADLLELADDIITKHTALGAGSPLTGNVDMTLFGTTVTTANTTLGEWDTNRALAQAKHNEALNIIGYGEGQTSQTAGTLYYDLNSTRDRLLQANIGNEERLTQWGFNVVISSASTGKSTAGSIFIQQGAVPAGGIVNIELPDVNADNIESVTFEATGSALRYYFAATATDAPGATFLQVADGVKITLTVQQAELQLGYSDTNKKMNVQNPGTAEGQYRMSVRVK